jgi:predicted MFS family arabinose efflux permease
LPTYLEQATRSKTMGDTISATLFGASIIGAILVPTLADRLRAPKTVLLTVTAIAFGAIAFMPFAAAEFFWVLVPVAGASTQGVGTLSVTRVVQTKEVGFAYAGTALGLVGGMTNFGGFVMPAIGGPLAEVNVTWPFVLWAAFVLLGAGCFAFLRSDRAPAGASG